MPERPGRLEVSVIIPTRDGALTLPPLLRSLQEQSLDRDRFEVIVVDNGSRDDTAGVAERHGAMVVQDSVANRSRARNRGAEVARTGLYAFTDADCVAHPGWLSALLACASKAPLVAGHVITSTRDRPNAIERFERLWRFGQEAWVRDGWAATANLLAHADAFEAVGGFDTAWRHYGEDVDFCLRTRDAGFPLAFCGAAVVEHRGEHELRPLLRRFFMHGYGGTQAWHRLGVGGRAWRDPRPALSRDRALRGFGHRPDAFEPEEWRRMARIARAGYVARIAGSVWAELVRAR